MTAITSVVKPGALFTYQEREDLPILLVEVVRLDTEDGAAICAETLSTDSKVTEAVFDIALLEEGAFTYVGDVVPDSEHVTHPRVGDLFLYSLEPMADWPDDGVHVVEIRQVDPDGEVHSAVSTGPDARGWWESWYPDDMGTHGFAYVGRVREGSEGF
jgi:hypothetical protein